MTKTPFRFLALTATGAFAIACSNNDPPPQSTLFNDSGTPTEEAGAADSSSQPDGAVVLPDGAVVTPDGSAACTLTTPPASQTCAACLQGSCCLVANACTADTDCASLLACIAGCAKSDAGPVKDGGTDGVKCSQGCMMTYPAAISEAAQYDACRAKSCAQQCP